MQLLKIYYIIQGEKLDFEEEFKKIGRCFNWGKQGHFAKAYKAPRRKRRRRPTISTRSTILLMYSSR